MESEITEIVFSANELKHLSLRDTKELKKIKQWAKNLMNGQFNKYCPVCGQRMLEDVTPLMRFYYCEICDYTEHPLKNK